MVPENEAGLSAAGTEQLMELKRWAMALCGCLFAGASAASTPAYAPRVGEVHPDFVLPRIDTREPVSLSQFRGKKVLLIHLASW